MSEKTVYRAFKVYCYKNGVMLKQIAARLGVTEANLRNILNGKQRMTEEFMAITAEYLDADVFELFPESRFVQHIMKKMKVVKR
jgi:transcriptional regulator with XRE-family HTH domain